MCKQDISIKRKTAANAKVVATANNSDVAALKGNPNRTTLIIAQSAGFVTGTTVYTTVKAGTGVDAIVLATLSNFVPSMVLRLEDVGMPLTYDIWLNTNDAGQPTYTVTEVFFNEALEDL